MSRHGRMLLVALLVAAPYAKAAAPPPVTFRIEVKGLACDLCAWGLKKKLAALPGVEKVAAVVETGTVTLEAGPDAAPSPGRVAAAVADAGHEIVALHLTAPARVERERLVVGAWSVALAEPPRDGGVPGGTIAGIVERAGDGYRLVAAAGRASTAPAPAAP